MKKAISIFFSAVLLLTACQKYDDKALQDRIGNVEVRVTNLESVLYSINSNVASVQSLVEALQQSVTVSVVSKTKDGFTITFSDGQTVEIKNGESGAKGDTPVIGVKAEGDTYYWTVDGKWLTDANGKKVAVFTAAPTLKIENGHWFASFDGKVWFDLGEVKNSGVSSDLSITEDENYVYFTFASTGETIKISKTGRFTIDIAGTDFFLEPGQKTEIPYSIYGADGTEHLFIKGDGFTCSYDAEKIYVTPNEGVTAGEVLVYAVRNSDQRMCGVVLSFGPNVFVVSEAAIIPAAGGEVSVTVKTNQDYEVTIPDAAKSWLSVTLPTRAEVREEAVTFTAQPNEGEARTAAVTFKAASGLTLTVTVYQAGSGETSGVKAVTIAEFNAAPDSDTQVYELVGTIGGNINATYGNFDLTDETGTVYVYGLTATELGYGAKNDKSYGSLGLNAGDKIKIRGYRGTFNDKIEVMYAWFIEKVGGDTPPGPSDVKAVTIAQFNAAPESDSQVYELVGTIGGSINTTYGNFDLTDDSGTVYVYGLTATELGYGAKNDKSFASLDLDAGDKIKIRGYRGLFNDKIEVMYAWFIEKLEDGGGSQGGEETSDVKAVTIAQFNAAPESSTQVYELVGTIGGSINTTYGNFDLTDDSGTVYVYGLTATELGYGASNDKSYGSLGLKAGDKIKIRGYRGSYGDKIEVVYAWFIEKLADGGGSQGGGGEATGDFASNVTWTSGSDQSYNEKATVNGTSDVAVLKLGTSSKTGTSTLTLPAGSKSLTFYALSWKGKPSKLVFKVDGKEVGSVEPAANDGLSNSNPYTLTVTNSDKYTITFSATSTVTVETSGSNTRAALFGIQAK